jgi:hypothetical protein
MDAGEIEPAGAITAALGWCSHWVLDGELLKLTRYVACDPRLPATPNPGAVRLASTWAGAGSAARPCSQSGLMVSHWKRPAPCDRPRSRRLIDGQVNRDA